MATYHPRIPTTSPHANVLPASPTPDLAAYRWLLRFLFADCDAPPPPTSSLERGSRPLARKGVPDATP